MKKLIVRVLIQNVAAAAKLSCRFSVVHDKPKLVSISAFPVMNYFVSLAPVIGILAQGDLFCLPTGKKKRTQIRHIVPSRVARPDTL